MDLKAFLLDFKKERKFDTILTQMQEDEVLEKQFFDLLNWEEEYPYTDYGSWILVHYAQSFPENAVKYHTTIIDAFIKNKGETVLRNLAGMLGAFEIQTYREGELLERITGILENPQHKVALHVHAIYLSMKFCEKYPELKDEIRLLITERLEHPTPALRVAARKFEKLCEMI